MSDQELVSQFRTKCGVRATESLIYRFLRDETELDGLMQLHRDLFPVKYDRSFFDFMLQSNTVCLIASDSCSGELVGFATGRRKRDLHIYNDLTHLPSKNSAYIMTLGVVPSHQRTGVASRLLDYLTRAMRLLFNADLLELDVLPSNKTALAFYQKHGYAVHSVIPSFYTVGDTAYDSWRLRKLVPSAPKGDVDVCATKGLSTMTLECLEQGVAARAVSSSTVNWRYRVSALSGKLNSLVDQTSSSIVSHISSLKQGKYGTTYSDLFPNTETRAGRGEVTIHPASGCEQKESSMAHAQASLQRSCAFNNACLSSSSRPDWQALPMGREPCPSAFSGNERSFPAPLNESSSKLYACSSTATSSQTLFEGEFQLNSVEAPAYPVAKAAPITDRSVLELGKESTTFALKTFCQFVSKPRWSSTLAKGQDRSRMEDSC